MIRQVRRIITLFLVQLSLLISLFLGWGNSGQALANATFPKGDNPDTIQMSENAQINAQRAKQAEEKSQDNNDSIVDKLNLNEPIPDSTKTFFDQVQGKEGVINKTEPEFKK